MITDLRTIHIFSSLPDDVLLAINERALLKKYRKGNVVIWTQDECRAVYFVVSGMVEVFQLSHNGREQVIEHIKPGESFNLVPVYLTSAFNQANVRAVSDTDILSIDKQSFLDLIGQFPVMSKSVAGYFAMRLSYMVNKVEGLALHSVRQRLAAFLINQADKQEQETQPRWTQEDMARQLGTVRDVIGRALRKLEDEELIKFQRERILLVDREAIQRLADGKE